MLCYLFFWQYFAIVSIETIENGPASKLSRVLMTMILQIDWFTEYNRIMIEH